MKTVIKSILLIILPNLIFAQKINSVDCSITYLPTIKHEKKSTKFSKKQALKIDSLINLKYYEIDLNNDDLITFENLINKKDYQGIKIYDISDSTIQKIKKDKKIELNFAEIDSTKSKSIVDLLSGVIDGAPFRFIAKTKNNKFQFQDNLAGGPTLKNLKEYLIFYSIFDETKFCGNKNSLKNYFSRENLLKNVIYCISRMESEY